jgi:hypothetical protein
MRAQEPDQQLLLERIAYRRHDLDTYLKRARPRCERMTVVTIVSSAIAAALTAGPALGGKPFTDTITVAMDLETPIWRPLCFLAMTASVVAAICANLSRSKNAEARIISAEACNTELEGLQTLLEFHQVPMKQAVKMFQESIAKVPFVEDDSPLETHGHE